MGKARIPDLSHLSERELAEFMGICMGEVVQPEKIREQPVKAVLVPRRNPLHLKNRK